VSEPVDPFELVDPFESERIAPESDPPYAAGVDPVLARAEQRRRATVVLSAISTVALVLVGVVVIAVRHGGGSSPTATGPTAIAQPASQGVLADLTGVPVSVETTVGSGLSSVGMKAVSGAPQIAGAKPTVLFVGAEFCPYCAAERWSIIQALSRFGTFTGIAQIRSSEDNLPTFDFAAASYSSKYVTFTPIELEGQRGQQLRHLTALQSRIFSTYSGGGSFPFLYVAGQYAQSGAGFSPELLAGLDQQQVAAQLTNPSTDLTRSIVGEANVLTAAICDVDGNAPTPVCAGTPEGPARRGARQARATAGSAPQTRDRP
jgi:thiol-disulfide isomerase/thioredoxin